jgi:hypothetical protein
MYYSLNNEKKPERIRNLPESIIGAYLNPRLVGRKIIAVEEKTSKPVSKMKFKIVPKDEISKKVISSKISLNNSITSIEDRYATIDINRATSQNFQTINALPSIRHLEHKKLTTIDRDYIKSNESIITKFKLQNLGIKTIYKNIIKNSVNTLSISKYDNINTRRSIV